MFRVADLKVGQPDEAGRPVDEIFVKRMNYGIYGTGELVVVQYADDPQIEERQIALVNPLLELCSHLQFLAHDLHRSDLYRANLAVALRVALDGDPATARILLQQVIGEAVTDRARVGRQSYLVLAGCLSSLSALLLIGLGGELRNGAASAGSVLLSAGGGALGALLSIITAIEKRAVMLGDDWRTNAMDGGLRVLMGIVSAFAVSIFFSIGLVPQVGITVLPGWQSALAIGFVAGFLERLVPDLLSRFTQNTGAAVAAPSEPLPTHATA